MSTSGSDELVSRRREEILIAALECFGEKGFVATRMKDIAAHVEMSVGNLYNYFRNKDDIVETLAQRQIDRLIDKLRRTDYEDQEQQIRDLTEIAMTRLNLRNAIFALDVMNASTSNMKLSLVFQRYDKACREALLAVYQQKKIPNPEVRLEMDMCLLDGLTIRAIVDPMLDARRLAEAVARHVVLA